MAKIRGIKPEFWTDEDIIELSMAARLLFIGLWNLACDNGHLPDKPKQIKIRLLPADDVDASELLDELVSHGRITREDGHLTIHNFAKHQKPHRRWWTTCDLPLCTIPDDAPPQGFSRGTTGEQPLHTVDHGGTTADVDGEGDSDKETSLSEIADAIPDKEPVRDDVTRLCQHLQAKIVENGSKRPNITQAWRRECRLLLDRDGKTEQQVMAAIDWCQADSFWKTNILSMPKLREKYDQIRLKAQEQRGVSQTALRSVPEPFTPEPPPPEIADDPEACERWYTDQYARRSA